MEELQVTICCQCLILAVGLAETQGDVLSTDGLDWAPLFFDPPPPPVCFFGPTSLSLKSPRRLANLTRRVLSVGHCWLSGQHSTFGMSFGKFRGRHFHKKGRCVSRVWGACTFRVLSW